MQDFARRGFLVPVDDVVGDLVDEYYAPVWRDLATVDGKLYGVWYKAANKSVVWYNTNIFAEVGRGGSHHLGRNDGSCRVD